LTLESGFIKIKGPNPETRTSSWQGDRRGLRCRRRRASGRPIAAETQP